MKKTLLRILLAVTLSCAAIAFIGCGKDGDKNSPSKQDKEYGNDYENPDYDGEYGDFSGDSDNLV